MSKERKNDALELSGPNAKAGKMLVQQALEQREDELTHLVMDLVKSDIEQVERCGLTIEATKIKEQYHRKRIEAMQAGAYYMDTFKRFRFKDSDLDAPLNEWMVKHGANVSW